MQYLMLRIQNRDGPECCHVSLNRFCRRHFAVAKKTSEKPSCSGYLNHLHTLNTPFGVWMPTQLFDGVRKNDKMQSENRIPGKSSKGKFEKII